MSVIFVTYSAPGWVYIRKSYLIMPVSVGSGHTAVDARGRFVMKCDIRREDGTVTVVLSGRIGVAEAVELRHRLFPELTAGILGVLLRMDEVADLDSSGLGLLLALRNLSADIGATFEIKNAGAWLGPKLGAVGLASR